MCRVCSSWDWVASSLVRTTKNPITAARMPKPAIQKGRAISLLLLASAAEAIMLPTKDSKRSAPIPATSPTLSPTLSAMVAGFLGSSSGMLASTFPTRSAPTSAALV